MCWFNLKRIYGFYLGQNSICIGAQFRDLRGKPSVNAPFLTRVWRLVMHTQSRVHVLEEQHLHNPCFLWFSLFIKVYMCYDKNYFLYSLTLFYFMNMRCSVFPANSHGPGGPQLVHTSHNQKS